jgi:hypothetical protein
MHRPVEDRADLEETEDVVEDVDVDVEEDEVEEVLKLVKIHFTIGFLSLNWVAS